MLAEVLREREAQLKLKQAKEERTKHISDKNVQVQEQVAIDKIGVTSHDVCVIVHTCNHTRTAT